MYACKAKPFVYNSICRVERHIGADMIDLVEFTTLDIFRERYYLYGETLDSRRLLFTATQAFQDDHSITLGSEWAVPNGTHDSLYVASSLRPVA